MEILGSLHHFVAYEDVEQSSNTHDVIFPSSQHSTLFGLLTLFLASGLQQSLMTSLMAQIPFLPQTGLPLQAATVADVPIGDLVEAMVGENSDMAEIVDDSEEVEVTINLQQSAGETIVSVEGRYDQEAETVSPEPTVSAVPSNGVLKYGVRGESVVRLQDQLKALGYFSTTSTGYFGDITEAAVIQFQYANFLAVDGVAGPQTLGLLQQRMDTQVVANTYAVSNAGVQDATTSNSLSRPTPQTTQTRVISTNPSSAQVAPYSSVTATPRSNLPIPAANPATSIDGAKVGTELYIGSQGQIVRDLQQLLKQAGQYSGPVTGYFGPLTMDAVKSFQGENGLAPNGIVGVKTLMILNTSLNR